MFPDRMKNHRRSRPSKKSLRASSGTQSNRRLTQRFVPQFGDTHVYLKGTATNLKPGDAILFVGSEREQFRAANAGIFGASRK